MLACALAKAGIDVLLLDAESHPRFSIAESMIIEASEVMRSLTEAIEDHDFLQGRCPMSLQCAISLREVTTSGNDRSTPRGAHCRSLPHPWY